MHPDNFTCFHAKFIHNVIHISLTNIVKIVNLLLKTTIKIKIQITDVHKMLNKNSFSTYNPQ